MFFDNDHKDASTADHKKENLDAEIITGTDVTKAWFFIQELFDKMLHVTGTQVDRHLVDMVTSHMRRVADMAEYIGKKADLDCDFIRFEALCHDCQKINPQKPGGVNDLSHAIVASGPLAMFMTRDLRKKVSLVNEICMDVCDHVAVICLNDASSKKYKFSRSFYGYVLRCANMLDYISASGLVYEVEQRQRRYSLAYQEDGGDLGKSLMSAIEKRKRFLDDFYICKPLYKTELKGFRNFNDQLYAACEAVGHLVQINELSGSQWIESLKLSRFVNMAEFRKAFKVFIEQKLRHS